MKTVLRTERACYGSAMRLVLVLLLAAIALAACGQDDPPTCHPAAAGAAFEPGALGTCTVPVFVP